MKGDALRKVKIERNKSYDHHLEVHTDNQNLFWEFKCTEETKLTILSPVNKRVVWKESAKSGSGLQGNIILKKGDYSLVFSNESYWKESVLQYRFAVS